MSVSPASGFPEKEIRARAEQENGERSPWRCRHTGLARGSPASGGQAENSAHLRRRWDSDKGPVLIGEGNLQNPSVLREGQEILWAQEYPINTNTKQRSDPPGLGTQNSPQKDHTEIQGSYLTVRRGQECGKSLTARGPDSQT